jgi:hypothetical protein
MTVAARCIAKPPPGAADSGAKVSQLRLSLWTADGSPIDAQTLKIAIDGAPAKLIRLGSANDPLLLHAVLDLTGDLSLVDPAREALIAEIHKTAATVSLLRAQDGLRVLEDPGAPKSKIEETLRGLSINGRAGLLDTIGPAAALSDAVLKGARVRSAVLFVTDSVITNYREDYTNPVVNSSDANDMSRRFPTGLVKEKIRQIREQLSTTLSPVFLVHLNFLRDTFNEAYQTGLLDLAVSTGGAAGFCRTPADIPERIAEAFARAASLQVAEVEVRVGRKQRPYKIAASAAAGVQLQCRPSYLPAVRKEEKPPP